MIEFFDMQVEVLLSNMFSDLISNGVDDVIYTPVELALGKRNDLEATPKYPFLSFYRSDPAKFFKDDYIHSIATKGVRFCLPDASAGDPGIEARGLPVQLNYQINYWDDETIARALDFNEIWIERTRINKEITVTFPVVTNEFDTEIDFIFQYTLGDLTDNSQIERQYDTGVDIRYTGDLSIQGILWKLPADGTADGEVPLIEEVILNYYIRHHSPSIVDVLDVTQKVTSSYVSEINSEITTKSR